MVKTGSGFITRYPFPQDKENREKKEEELQNELFKQIGELKVENEFLKNLSKLPPLSAGKEK